MTKMGDMTDVGVGVIGCGYWGPQLIRNFSELPDATVHMAADLQPERRLQMAQQFPHVVTTASHDLLLEDPRIEAVAIATPIRTHYPLAREALLRGKHVLVEKPLASSAAEAEELISLAEDRNLRLMVGHTFEYNPAVEVLRNLVRTETLGKIHYIDGARLNLGLFQHDINVVWDLAPHDISILLYVLGEEPIAVSARGAGHIRSDIEDVAYLDFEFPSGISAHLHVSWLEPCKVRRVTVVGDRKMAVYNDVSNDEKIRIYDKGVSRPDRTATFGEFQLSYRYGDIVVPRINWQEPLRLECSHFVDCIRRGKQPQSDGWVGLRVVEILEALSYSLAHGGIRVNMVEAAERRSEDRVSTAAGAAAAC